MTGRPPAASRAPQDSHQLAVSHPELFRAWADIDDLEPLGLPQADPRPSRAGSADHDDGEPPWRFLDRYEGPRSLDARRIEEPKASRPPTLHLTVLLGLTGQRSLVEGIRHWLAVDPDHEPRVGPGKDADCFSAAVNVNREGLPDTTAMVVSRLVLLASELAASGPDLQRALRALPARVDAVQPSIEELKLDCDDPAEVWSRLVEQWRVVAATASRADSAVTAMVYGQWVRSGKKPEAAALESFYSADLRRLAATSINKTLQIYLAGTPGKPPAGAVDVAAAVEQARRLAPGTGPDGRWPTLARGHDLTTSQRVAAIEMSDRIVGASSAVVAINGPPGTGKSSLLRELVAQQIVKRAAAIAALGPDRAFNVQTIKDGEILRAHPDIAGFEIVVASSNNKAVANVADVLNQAERAAANPPHSHLSAAARSVEDKDWWALICLILGRRDNIAEAAKLVTPRAVGQPTSPWKDWFAAAELPPMDDALAAFLKATDRVEALSAAARHDAAARAEIRPRVERLSREFGSDSRDWAARAQRLSASTREELDGIEQRRPGWLARQLSTRSWRRWTGEHAAAQAMRERNEELRIDAEASAQLGPASVIEVADWMTRTARCQERNPPNVDEDLEWARVELFANALQLHGAALAPHAASGVVDRTMSDWAQAAQHLGNFTPQQRRVLWRDLFTIVPVVTTTFASAGRMLADFGPDDDLGTVVIDEAGQAPAYQAVPLLSRARRAVIVGDPQQLEPVVTLDPELLQGVMGSAGLDTRWSPDYASVQHLADAASQVGTEITSAGGSAWVGLPLRAHFRCANPMFDIANRISYDGQMVLQRKPQAKALSTLGGMGSMWIDAPLAPGDTHWGDEDAEILKQILEGETPTDELDLFVIAPFRDAVTGACSTVQGLDKPEETASAVDGCLGGDQPSQTAQDFDDSDKRPPPPWTAWAEKHVGTIHTFQGREATTVILLLAASASRPGAQCWAASKPNLLNVAVTRAKERLIVVGNIATWSKLANFKLLAERLNQVPAWPGRR